MRNIMIPFMARDDGGGNMKFSYTIQHFECDYIFLLLFNDKGRIGKHANLSLFPVLLLPPELREVEMANKVSFVCSKM